jgi:hypothetical protein
MKFPKRKGLGESLEAYAARCGVSPAEARPAWRWDGLHALLYSVPSRGLAVCLRAYTTRSTLCRIAPGASVPTRTPTEEELYSYVDRY